MAFQLKAGDWPLVSYALEWFVIKTLGLLSCCCLEFDLEVLKIPPIEKIAEFVFHWKCGRPFKCSLSHEFLIFA